MEECDHKLIPSNPHQTLLLLTKYMYATLKWNFILIGIYLEHVDICLTEKEKIGERQKKKMNWHKVSFV